MERERDSDEEQMVTDLEYISTNVVLMEDTTTTIPTDLMSKYNNNNSINFDTESTESSSSSEMSGDDDKVINCEKTPKIKTLTYSVDVDEYREDGELSSEKDYKLDPHNTQLTTTNMNMVDDSHLTTDVQLDSNTTVVCFGSIANVVDNTIVVKATTTATTNKTASRIVDVGTAVFLENKYYIGEICDIFGRVELPFYSIVLKKTSIPLVREGLNVFYADTSNTVVFVDMDQINKIDDPIEELSENTTTTQKHQSTTSQRKRNRATTNSGGGGKQQQNCQNNDQTYLNAWPPSIKMLKNSYDVRTFYKHGQWPSSYENKSSKH